MPQVNTKDQSVSPIEFKYTKDFGRKDPDNYNPDGSEKSYLERKLNEINPIKVIHKATDGINLGLKNIRTQLRIEPIALKAGADNQYKTIKLKNMDDQELINKAVRDQKEIQVNIEGDKKYLTIGQDQNTKIYLDQKTFTINQLTQNPSLASYSLNANGIMNNADEATINAIKQSGGFDGQGRLTLMYDPSAKGEAKDPDSIKGIILDSLEVGINYFGSGMVITKGAAEDQKLIQALTQNAQKTGDIVTLSGHSAGGRRNYVNLLNSDPNQYVDANGRPVLQAQFFGAPANVLNLKQATQNSGATYLGQQNNNGDFVGNGLGGNGNVLQAGWSVANIVSLFDPKVPFTDIKLKSPHSNYYCQGSWCNYNNNQISTPK